MKHDFASDQRESLLHFLHKLQEKKPSKLKQQQPAKAVTIYYALIASTEHNDELPSPKEIMSSAKTNRGFSPPPLSSQKETDSLKDFATPASFNIEAGLDRAVRKRHYAFLGRLASIFERAIVKNRIKKTAPPFGLALALDSVIDAFFLLRQDIPEHHFDPKFPEAILDVFFNGLAIREPFQSVTAESEAS